MTDTVSCLILVVFITLAVLFLRQAEKVRANHSMAMEEGSVRGSD